MRHAQYRTALLTSCILGTLAVPSWAQDAGRVRFPSAGGLGGEIVAQVDNPGFFASAVVTQSEVDKLTDSSGNTATRTVSGTFSTPAPVAGAIRTATYSGAATVDLKQSQSQLNLVVGYVSQGIYAGGRLSLTANLPYAMRLDRTTNVTGPTPTLSTLAPALTTPPLPAGTAAAAQASAQAGFNTGYQNNLKTASSMATGVEEGLGDVELTAAWSNRTPERRVIVGATLAMPTGKYDAASSLNIGVGNFYTLRAGAAYAFDPMPNLTVGLRGTLATNTRNKDTQVKRGDFAALELAAAYRSSFGVFGPHVVMVRQFRDDDGNPQGANRYSITNAGLFYAMRLPGPDVGINLSYTTTLDSKNAMSGSIYQVRISKAF